MITNTCHPLRKKAYHVLFVATLFLFFSPFASAKSKTILVLGDSISAEYGLTYGTGWAALLSKTLEKENIKGDVINASISGDTTNGGKNRLPELLDTYRPEIVIIELGGNDGLRGLSLSAMKSNLKTMVVAAQEVGAKVILTGMQIPGNYGPRYTAKFENIYREVSEETHATLVPALMKGMVKNDVYFQADGIHPTEAAQPIMHNNIWEYLAPMLKK